MTRPFDREAFEAFRRRPDTIAMAERISAAWGAPASEHCDDCGELRELDGQCLYCPQPSAQDG